jgi:hypothetical protein
MSIISLPEIDENTRGISCIAAKDLRFGVII